jgi:YYY domain-containing protein
MMEVGLVILWLLAFLALGATALPFVAWLLPETASGAFAIPAALAVLGVVGHLVGQIAFGWPALLAGLGVLGCLSAFGAWSGELDVRPGRLGEYAAVFSAGFLLVVVIRGVDPAIAPLPVSAGEKFLDFGLLRTLGRSGSLPPESMWFADEPMQYYYGGQLVVSLLATMTGTSAAYAYNLALAGFFGTLVLAAYGLAASIARPYEVSERIAGLFGAFFVGVAANLETAIRLLAWQLPEGVAETLVTSLGLDESVASWSPDQFWYWDASRVVPVEPASPDSNFLAATEFPLFSWLNGDLHAHMLSQPFMLLAAVMLLAVWRTPTSHRRLLLFVALPPLVGLLAFLNLWSLPTVLGLTVLCVALSPADPREMLPEWGRVERDATPLVGRAVTEGARIGLGLLVALVVFAGGVLWTLPFWTTVILESPSRSVAYWDQWTPLGPLLVVFGGFLAALVVYLSRGISATSDRIPSTAVLSTGGFVVVLAFILGVPALGLTVALVGAGWWLLRRETVGFEVLLLVAGAGILFVVEFVTIEGERFNVIFKPYVHVWLFWAISTAVVLPRLAAGWPAGGADWRGQDEQSSSEFDETDTRRRRQTGAALAVVLVLVTVPYAGFALHDHVTTGTETTEELGMTLDGTAYLEVHYPDEAPAIRWLDDRSGQPTILTTAPASYTWDSSSGDGAAAPSSLTGIPTVAGWSHERQYRGDEVYTDRVTDVWAMYGGDADTQRELLASYDIQFIYVGPAERHSDRFDVSVDQLEAVSVAESWEHVTIYEVDQEQLDA